MTAITITLPWPDKRLSPNARVHWARKAVAVKEARRDAALLVRAALGPRKPSWTAARLSMVFRPPDRRRRDIDNMVASMKQAVDGIADALGIDDSRFTYSYAVGEVVKGGAVWVMIEADVVAAGEAA